MADWASGYHPVHEPFVTKIVNVHWGTRIYLYLSLFVGNFRSGKPGPNPIGAVPEPGFEIKMLPGKNSSEIDEYIDPDGNKVSSGPNGCLQYIPRQTAFVAFGPEYIDENGLPWKDPIYGPIGHDPQQTYDALTHGVFSSAEHLSSTVNGACPILETQTPLASYSAWSATASRSETYYAQLATVPINYASSNTHAIEFLYAISPGEDLISVKVSDLLRHVGSFNIGSDDGSGNLYVAVYSTSPQALTRLSDIVRYGDYDETKIDPDSWREMTLNSNHNDQEFFISVGRDNNPLHQQVDNYGRVFQPYKIKFRPTANSHPGTPFQPPEQLGVIVETGG
jgi:hypothetical protein